MPLVTSGQFAYVYKVKSIGAGGDFAVRCFRGYLRDRDQRYREIQRQIQTHQVPFLSDFTYAPEGILVEGSRFPILFMKWIEGPTLDLYLDEMIGRRDVLLHLAAEWVKLVATLRKARIAHGDLQHGNIILERGRFRLVDHDGIFVPAMMGWSSSELGHQHYQHPRRDARFFDAPLDNFSALVIYLSLLSLAAQPALWAEYHDENLLFTKTDFIDPASSGLFAKIRELGPEHRRLADILATAATGEPPAVPSLADLVDVKSGLPAWMTAPPEMEPKTKTREAVEVIPAQTNGGSQWKPWQARLAKSTLPISTPSPTFQTIFSGPAAIATAPSGIRDPDEVFRNTGIFAREFLRKTFIWWYWGVYLCFKFIGLDFFYSLLVALLCLALFSLTYGFVRARGLAQTALQGNSSPLNLLGGTAGTATSFPRITASAAGFPPASITANDPIIGNLALNIYHQQNCGWVKQISQRNRVSFASSAEALAAGFKSCRVCSP
ncbi:MAG: serine/threonine protein kinase [Acidobacteria bacterium]|nr:serine/threonine protein kinase [Acidobacteriota bacterium]